MRCSAAAFRPRRRPGVALRNRHGQIALPPNQTGARCTRVPRLRRHLPAPAQQPGQQTLADLPTAAEDQGAWRRCSGGRSRMSQGNYRCMETCSIPSAAWRCAANPAVLRAARSGGVDADVSQRFVKLFGLLANLVFPACLSRWKFCWRCHSSWPPPQRCSGAPPFDHCVVGCGRAVGRTAGVGTVDASGAARRSDSQRTCVAAADWFDVFAAAGRPGVDVFPAGAGYRRTRGAVCALLSERTR